MEIRFLFSSFQDILKFLKFRYFQKAIRYFVEAKVFWKKILYLLARLLSNVKTKWEIFFSNSAFLEYLSFNGALFVLTHHPFSSPFMPACLFTKGLQGRPAFVHTRAWYYYCNLEVLRGKKIKLIYMFLMRLLCLSMEGLCFLCNFWDAITCVLKKTLLSAVVIHYCAR